MNNHRKLLLLCATILGSAAFTAAQAQERAAAAPSGATIDEIIVTAQRREQALSDVPAAISAVGGATLEAARVQQINDLAGKIPNFRFTRFNLSDTQLFIRGIGSNIDSAAFDRSVATFIDEVYIGRAASAATDIFDLERVEVLRGPQGTLYGKNVVGGAINYVTRTPTSDRSARLKAGVGNYGLYEIAGLVSGPLHDDWAGSLSVSYRNRDGYTTNLSTGHDQDNERSLTTRAVAAYSGEALRLRLSGDYSEVSGAGVNWYPLWDGSSPLGVRQSFRDGASYRSTYMGPDGHQNVRAGGLTAKLEADVWGGALTSVAGLRRSMSDISIGYMGTGTPRAADGFPQLPQNFEFQNELKEDASQFSLEVRYLYENDKYTLLTGAFVIRENVDRTEFTSQSTPSRVSTNRRHILDGRTQSYAAFADLTYRPIDRLEVDAGLRYTMDDRDFDMRITGMGSLFGTFPTNPFSTRLHERWGAFTPKISVRYEIAPQLSIYAVASRGYKSGGFDGQPTAVEGLASVAPEYVWNYEAGVKGLVWSSRLRFELAAFRMDYTDLQVQYTRTLPGTAITRTILANAAAATVKGVESSFQLALGGGFDVGGTFGYLNSEIIESAAPTISVGNRLPNSPKFSYSFNGNYKTQLTDDLRLSARLEYTHADKSFQNAENSRQAYKPASSVWDASASLAHDGGLEFSVWGKNLTDELVITYVNPSALGGLARFAPPKTYGATLAYRW